MFQLFLGLAGCLGALSVAAGAFASHALKAQLSDRALEIFETGAKYQMYHSLGLLLIAVLISQASTMGLSLTWLNTAGISFIVGIILFSGSLYGLSFLGIKVLGAITPLGGVGFIIGWLCVAIAAFTSSKG
ncbi:MAG: DUF423 domain-containing protein [Cyanobacteria bacterium P01_F01_bin.150]